MKETSFIEQNKEKWKRFQDLAAAKDGNPEELADLYSDITDDLSYAQTFYNRRTVRVYLNQIAQGIHNLVHREKGDSFRKFFTVWKVSLPIEIYRARKHLLFAFALFTLWAILGAVTTHFNPDFPRSILGDEYVNQTLRNIKMNTPLDIYQDDNQLHMFLRISMNNIKISFFMFIFGFFFTIGTHIYLFQNAVMLGAFQYFFHLKGVLAVSFLGIWIHGAFEISSIVIAAGAGITLGNGWLFPGSYTRLQSLQHAARRGLKIMMSLVPFLLVAGFLESYVTHNYLLLPEWSKWVLITFCFGLILFYFVAYPMIVARKHPELLFEKHTADYTYTNTFTLNRLRNFGQSFADSFSFYRVHIGRILKINMLFAVPLVVIMTVLQDISYRDLLIRQHWYDWAGQLGIIMGTRMETLQDWLVMAGWSVVLAILLLSVMYCFRFQEEKIRVTTVAPFLLQHFVPVWLCNIGICCVVFLVPWYLLIFALFLLPFVWLHGVTYTLGEGTIGDRIRTGFVYGFKSYGTILLSIAVVSLIIFLFAQPIAFVGSIHRSPLNPQPEMASDILDQLADFVKNVARNFTADPIVPANILRQAVYILFVFLSLPLYVMMMGFIYGDVNEKNRAKGLHEAFAAFGKRKRNQETAADFE